MFVNVDLQCVNETSHVHTYTYIHIELKLHTSSYKDKDFRDVYMLLFYILQKNFLEKFGFENL